MTLLDSNILFPHIFLLKNINMALVIIAAYNKMKRQESKENKTKTKSAGKVTTAKYGNAFDFFCFEH